ncbi:hypothetical protein HUW51_22445 [Adhaeribacter swui]|uniref:Uncharacterized protein n=1 Tax=Adhaeribacter swui TaxID=2086471 RepID=A0A7G7GDV5_9BACT|nr:hypothetical protein [Adhaeribacter swui]QNF35339.1 hypothetical protein HUW51_22445 [Adhaeribacter swui]
MSTNDSTIMETTNCIQTLEIGNALLTVEADRSFVQLSWQQSPTAEDLALSASVVSEFIKENNIIYFLHDVRNVIYTDINLQRTFTSVFCPRILTAGVIRFVHLANYELPELLILDEITAYMQRKVITNKAVKMEICTTPEGAAEWLNNSGAKNTIALAPKKVKEAAVEQVSFEWAAAAQVSSSLKQYKDKAAMVFRILVKGKSYSEL